MKVTICTQSICGAFHVEECIAYRSGEVAIVSVISEISELY